MNPPFCALQSIQNHLSTKTRLTQTLIQWSKKVGLKLEPKTSMETAMYVLYILLFFVVLVLVIFLDILLACSWRAAVGAVPVGDVAGGDVGRVLAAAVAGAARARTLALHALQGESYPFLV
jgi:polyferredoxin